MLDRRHEQRDLLGTCAGLRNGKARSFIAELSHGITAGPTVTALLSELVNDADLLSTSPLPLLHFFLPCEYALYQVGGWYNGYPCKPRSCRDTKDQPKR